ncbi:MAG TPA: hypothetical protein VHE35_22560 [Kofleriaceae bacterium]|nr:hypothetical protein [Kofleriaceae bacterium]
MMIYRTLVVGLLGAIVLFLAQETTMLGRLDRGRVGRAGPRPALVDHRAPPFALAAALRPAEPAVDDPPILVHASRAAGVDPLAILGLDAAHRPIAIDDRAIEGAWPDAIRARWDGARAGSYFELRVVDAEGQHRMLVLVTI